MKPWGPQVTIAATTGPYPPIAVITSLNALTTLTDASCVCQPVRMLRGRFERHVRLQRVRTENGSLTFVAGLRNITANISVIHILFKGIWGPNGI